MKATKNAKIKRFVLGFCCDGSFSWDSGTLQDMRDFVRDSDGGYVQEEDATDEDILEDYAVFHNCAMEQWTEIFPSWRLVDTMRKFSLVMESELRRRGITRRKRR